MTRYQKLRVQLFYFGVSLVAAMGSIGCSPSRMLPIAYMPTPPKECEQVLGFKVDPLPPGKSNAAKLSVDMAKEGAARQQEHTVSKVCAEYALRTAGVMKDKETPAAIAAETPVAAAKTTPATKTGRVPSAKPETQVVDAGHGG